MEEAARPCRSPAAGRAALVARVFGRRLRAVIVAAHAGRRRGARVLLDADGGDARGHRGHHRHDGPHHGHDRPHEAVGERHRIRTGLGSGDQERYQWRPPGALPLQGRRGRQDPAGAQRDRRAEERRQTHRTDIVPSQVPRDEVRGQIHVQQPGHEKADEEVHRGLVKDHQRLPGDAAQQRFHGSSSDRIASTIARRLKRVNDDGFGRAPAGPSAARPGPERTRYGRSAYDPPHPPPP